jgi:dissimilatory sulfite reductase (desulfoviridin) alpha/beta subunit
MRMAEKPEINVGELRKGGVVKLKEKDMYSIWAKTACCNLTSRQLRRLADITEKYASFYQDVLERGGQGDDYRI